MPANDPLPWSPASEEPDHALSALDGATVGQGVTLRVELAPTARGGVRPFRAFLDSADLGTTLAPIVTGAHRASDTPAMNWVEITDFAGSLPVTEGEVEVPEGIDIQVLQALANLVPPGGHLIAEYGSDHRRTTDRALRQGVPPAATPLGGMMFAAGCGVAFRDWRAADRGEGARRLQGYRATDIGHEARRAPETLSALERFMDSSAELDWDLQLKCRPLAEAAITVLRARLGVLASTFDVN